MNPGSQYQFEVGDVGPWGTTWSNNVSPYTFTAAPTATATAVSSSEIKVGYSQVAGAFSYQIDENVSGTWEQVQSVVTGLTDFTTYQFKVGATDPAGTTWSNVVSATTPPSHVIAVPGAVTATPGLTTGSILLSAASSSALPASGSPASVHPAFAPAAPAAPSLTATAVSPTQIDLSWNAVSGAVDYIVYGMTDGVWREFASTAIPTSFVVGGLLPGTTYEFEVVAIGSWGVNGSNVVTALTLPAPPTASAAAVSATGIQVEWTPVASATSYEVEQYESGAWQPVQPLDMGLMPHTTYEFRVGATNASGTTWSSVVSATTPFMHIVIVPGTVSAASPMDLMGTSASSEAIVSVLSAGSKRSSGLTVTA